jgi:hypothetical protein
MHSSAGAHIGDALCTNSSTLINAFNLLCPQGIRKCARVYVRTHVFSFLSRKHSSLSIVRRFACALCTHTHTHTHTRARACAHVRARIFLLERGSFLSLCGRLSLPRPRGLVQTARPPLDKAQTQRGQCQSHTLAACVCTYTIT